jgi:hypothetical protein
MMDLEDPNRRKLGRTTYAFQRVLLHPTGSLDVRPSKNKTVEHFEVLAKPSRYYALVLSMAPLLTPGVARAEPPAAPADDKQIQPPPTTTSHKAAEPERDAEAERINQRLRELEEKNRQLQDELSRLKEEAAFTQSRVEQLLPLSGRVSGYVDFGFFYVQGNGSGIRTDTGNTRFPEYQGRLPGSWVFMGDPLSTAVNARGEPADVGESRAVTFNPIGNAGKASFIANALNVALFAGVGESLTVNAMFDLVPRGRDVSNAAGLFLGDFLDVKLAYAEYIIPTSKVSFSLYAGKFDSVLGREYRIQESPDRLGVTPSLICRYTCGRPLGIKARARSVDNSWTVNVALTNGSSFVEMFPFYGEIDKNHAKTASGRLSYRFPLGTGLEFGASGAYGAQDLQSDDSVAQWHYGFDVHLDWKDVLLTGEFVQGRAPGVTAPADVRCGSAPCIRYKGAYGQLGYRLTNWLTPYVRVDWRDALHENGASFVYVSDLVRVSPGLHFEFGTNVIVKAEYSLNRELGRIPQFPNDVVTSALVVKY